MIPARTATLVLVGPDRRLVGALPELVAEVPWWQHVEDVVRLARERDGVEVAVLRLLRTQRPAMPGGHVDYLAEVDAATAQRCGATTAAVPEDLAALALGHDPHRAAYAEVGGPGASLAWASRELGGLAEVRQERTWNLSAMWRLTSTDGRAVWLKQVPSFFAHEPVALAWLARRAPESAPPLVAVGDEGRQLIAHVDGSDLYEADDATRIEIAARAHAIQLASVADVEELVRDGIPDRRGALLTSWIRTTLAGRASQHPARRLLAQLEAQVAELDACGLPAVLVHGDEHGGNVISDGERMVVVDWGDSFVGHPVFDAITLAGGASSGRPDVLAAWCALWRRSVPGCEPERALQLGRGVAALRSAAVYADFLDRIEVSEAPYHRADVPELLDLAVSLERG